MAIDPEVRIGHTHLKVADLERSLLFRPKDDLNQQIRSNGEGVEKLTSSLLCRL